ncbi:hypothetical protein MTO96_032348 [Rhipicephalus appendiculatus]
MKDYRRISTTYTTSPGAAKMNTDRHGGSGRPAREDRGSHRLASSLARPNPPIDIEIERSSLPSLHAGLIYRDRACLRRGGTLPLQEEEHPSLGDCSSSSTALLILP